MLDLRDQLQAGLPGFQIWVSRVFPGSKNQLQALQEQFVPAVKMRVFAGVESLAAGLQVPKVQVSKSFWPGRCLT